MPMLALYFSIISSLMLEEVSRIGYCAVVVFDLSMQLKTLWPDHLSIKTLLLSGSLSMFLSNFRLISLFHYGCCLLYVALRIRSSSLCLGFQMLLYVYILVFNEKNISYESPNNENCIEATSFWSVKNQFRYYNFSI